MIILTSDANNLLLFHSYLIIEQAQGGGGNWYSQVIFPAFHLQAVTICHRLSPKWYPKESKTWYSENLGTLYRIFKWLCPLFANSQGIHHTYIQGNNVRLLNYMCSASITNRISDLQFTKLSLPPSGFALWLIQRLLFNMCFVMKMKKKKIKKTLLPFPLLHLMH